MLEVPLALVKLRLRPTLGDRLEHADVGVADDPLRLARERAQECAPVGRMGGRKRFGAPKPRLSSYVSDRAEDIEGDPAGRNPPPGGVQGPDPEGQMVEQERPLARPGGRATGLEDNRREHLDPVGDELAVVSLAQLAGLGVEPKPVRAVAGNARGAHVGGASSNRVERLGDPAGDELVLARRLRALAALDPALTVLARVVPGLLPRQKLGEHVRLASSRSAPVALAPVPRTMSLK